MRAAVVTSRFGAGERLQGMDTKHPFEKVVADHGATVPRVCRVLLADPDADDARSETFLAALRAYPDLPETANTKAWLVTTAGRSTYCGAGHPRPWVSPGGDGRRAGTGGGG
jgi:hypothetical protein